MSILLLGAGPGTNAVAWSPADLPGLFTTVIPALSRSQGKLWQNAAKTLPAVADGDPVRVAVCPLTGTEWVAPSDASRPILSDEGGGKWSLDFDGVNDVLLGPLSTPDQPFTLGARVRVAGVLPADNQFYATYRDNVFLFQPVGGTTQTAYAGSSVNGGTVAAGTYGTVIGVFNGASSVIRVDGVEATGNAGVNGGNPRPSIGAAPDGTTGATACRIAGATVSHTALSADDRALLDAFLSALA